MRVLMFSLTPSCYKAFSSGGYNGGGWLTSVEKGLRENKNVELAVSFIMDGEPFKVEKNKTTYYPIPNARKKIVYRILNRFGLFCNYVERKSWISMKERLSSVVKDFNPDIIEVFGTESPLGLVASVTNIPVVLHIQGLLNPYWNAFFPPSFSIANFIFQNYNPQAILRRLLHLRYFRMTCMREREIAKLVHNYIGRTCWDERVINVLNPNAKYFYGSEILRDEFYLDVVRKIPETPTFISTISEPMYKGLDCILKTAEILKNNYNLHFVWKVFGTASIHLAEKKTGIKHESVGVFLEGVASPKQLVDALINCTAYVHPSYIDNSPNSLCEAQILGCPSIATNVGGVSSLINNGNNGFLIPSNDPYQLAYLMRKLSQNKSLNIEMGERSKNIAKKRHNKDEVISSLLKTYEQIIRGETGEI